TRLGKEDASWTDANQTRLIQADVAGAPQRPCRHSRRVEGCLDALVVAYPEKRRCHRHGRSPTTKRVARRMRRRATSCLTRSRLRGAPEARWLSALGKPRLRRSRIR